MPSKKQKNEKNNEFDTSKNDEYNDDVHFEESEHNSIGSLENLRNKLKKCQKERQEYLDGWQRTKADLINARKEFERQRGEYVTHAREGLLEELLPVVDSFDMAFSNKEAWEKVDKNWRMGVEYIHSQLMKVLTENGVKVLEPIGETFDPKVHDSVESVQTDDPKLDHTIVHVRQRGFELHGKIVRPPKVVVYVYQTSDPK